LTKFVVTGKIFYVCPVIFLGRFYAPDSVMMLIRATVLYTKGICCKYEDGTKLWKFTVSAEHFLKHYCNYEMEFHPSTKIMKEKLLHRGVSSHWHRRALAMP
jgi:hypothetical protein